MKSNTNKRGKEAVQVSALETAVGVAPGTVVDNMGLGIVSSSFHHLSHKNQAKCHFFVGVKKAHYADVTLATV